MSIFSRSPWSLQPSRGRAPSACCASPTSGLKTAFAQRDFGAASGPYMAAGRMIWGVGSSENDFLKWQWWGQKESPHPAV